ncbi:DUF190 domain-containing protein [Mesorhizobium sp. M1C.F.Ca.ET.193.01.1.1]|uniref:DUF190 domain-containing protein n=1 Tax=unclassified Mesorhizobium TaxID=325217 RepID=UPI000FD48207|nr:MULTISPECIES: DUF190 domain-containing protein [unclassified Mesorhizobium]TGS95756.1 DUF190 domain-containing protein [bacterium M00.F.Ca.ET.177.01.1.1]RWA73251.1 MAG: DUF190 domain-containing protein [Mesorhizobium sp.]RWC01766.1 MAG: DUF190 domain-containing protein [Mesorhizobium sp.]RWG84161.1 MAG: DUF190 domain-containing protein [Mesorhizobium sp.]RWG86363.1 MAG: DUF190 domain-containing protein [Mesorhizobium sp.]
MELPSQCAMLRIFFGEDDRSADGRPLHEAIVIKARETGMAGATVLRGPLGFGRSSVLHTAKILRLSQDLPIIVEIIDAPEKIDALIPQIKALTRNCLITREKVEVIRYGDED